MEQTQAGTALARQVAGQILVNMVAFLASLDGRGGKVCYTVHVSPGQRSAKVEMPTIVEVVINE